MFGLPQDVRETSSTGGHERLLNTPSDDTMTERDSNSYSNAGNQLNVKSESSNSIAATNTIGRKRIQSHNFDDYFQAVKHPNDKISQGEKMSGLEFDNKILVQGSQIKKMGPVKTFFAIIKAYCAINVLLLPRAFANGGYLLSPIAMMTACFFEALCAARLTSVAHQY